MLRLVIVPLAVLGLLVCGCGKKKKARVTPAIARPTGYSETGLASWYGHPYHGRRAANGEIYDMEKLTAAHRTLPFNTWVKVRNLENSRDVDLRIIDRGPFINGRIIDVSHAAARQIGLIGPGVAKVRVEVITTPAAVSEGRFGVQVGAFRVQANAERLRQRMEKECGAARIVFREGQPGMWRVLAGEKSSLDAASGLADQLRARHEDLRGAYVVRLD